MHKSARWILYLIIPLHMVYKSFGAGFDPSLFPSVYQLFVLLFGSSILAGIILGLCRKRFRINSQVLIGLAIVFLIGLSSLWSYHPTVTLRYIPFWMFYVVFYTLVINFFEGTDGILEALYLFVFISFTAHAIILFLLFSEGRLRGSGHFLANYLGDLCLVSLPALTVLWWSAEKFEYISFYLYLTTGNILIALLSLSRMSLLILFLFFLTLLVLGWDTRSKYSLRERPSIPHFRYLLTGFLMFVTCLLPMYIIFSIPHIGIVDPARYLRAMEHTFGFLLDKHPEANVQSYYAIFLAILEMMEDPWHWLSGMGFGQFHIFYGEMTATKGFKAHNPLLNFLVNLGLPGFALMLTMFVLPLNYLYRSGVWIRKIPVHLRKEQNLLFLFQMVSVQYVMAFLINMVRSSRLSFWTVLPMSYLLFMSLYKKGSMVRE